MRVEPKQLDALLHPSLTPPPKNRQRGGQGSGRLPAPPACVVSLRMTPRPGPPERSSWSALETSLRTSRAWPPPRASSPCGAVLDQPRRCGVAVAQAPAASPAAAKSPSMRRTRPFWPAAPITRRLDLHRRLHRQHLQRSRSPVGSHHFRQLRPVYGSLGRRPRQLKVRTNADTPGIPPEQVRRRASACAGPSTCSSRPPGSRPCGNDRGQDRGGPEGRPGQRSCPISRGL